jgi:hypothetical protein
MDTIVFLDEDVFRYLVKRGEEAWLQLQARFPNAIFWASSHSLTGLLDDGLETGEIERIGSGITEFLQNHLHDEHLTLVPPELVGLLQWISVLYQNVGMFKTSGEAIALATARSLQEAGRFNGRNCNRLKFCSKRRKEFAEADLYPAELLERSPFQE